MGWREVVIDTPCKISFQNNYLTIRREEIIQIHVSEIKCVMLANTNINITGVALCELVKNKVNIVFCDEHFNPYGQLSSFYGCHNSSKKIKQQVCWLPSYKSLISTAIIQQKIVNQAKLLKKVGFDERATLLIGYADEVQMDDLTNREGHAAKVYFNTLFGSGFTRELASNINFGLNYGYTIILSLCNREIVSNGCITQLGINHRNEFNEFNLSCDLMEPFRIIVDEYIYENKDREFDKNYKYDLVNLLNKKIVIGNEMYLSNAISYCIKTILDALNMEDLSLMRLYEFV